MKAARLVRFAPDGVKVAEEPVPSAAPGHLVIKIRSAGINPFDWKVREGYIPTMKLPATMGGDLAGIVHEIGHGVTGFKVGDMVYGDAGVFGKGSGSFAEFVSADAGTVALMPDGLEHAQAAALPLAGVSALQALTEHIGLKRGQKILIHGGAGGIGSFAIQIARHLGAHVTTTARKEDMDFVKMLGADEAIDYKSQDFSTLRGFDAVFDTVAGDTYRKSFSVLKKGGIIVSMLEKPDEALMKQHGVRSIAQQTHVNAERLNRLSRLAESGAIRVFVDKAFPLEKVSDALDYLKKGHHRGKVVLNVAG
jgi:alcohol dehydrogenase